VTLHVEFGDADEAAVLALAADMAAHTSLKRVELTYAPLHMHAALDAVVDAALARQMNSLHFFGCHLSPASAPALVRLLGGGTLTNLVLSQRGEHLLDGPSAALLGAALQANATLTSLSLHSVDLWRDVDAAAVLLSALTGHPSLSKLVLFLNSVRAEHEAAAGATLGAFVAANAPALIELEASWSGLHDAALRPLLEALPRNTYLRALDICDADLNDAFARDVLLPAVRANTSLRTLHAWSNIERPGAVEATALVAARNGGGAA
jgi:hypothetical protein